MGNHVKKMETILFEGQWLVFFEIKRKVKFEIKSKNLSFGADLSEYLLRRFGDDCFFT